MKPVTDPRLLAQLDDDSSAVSDPKLLAALEGDPVFERPTAADAGVAMPDVSRPKPKPAPQRKPRGDGMFDRLLQALGGGTLQPAGGTLTAVAEALDPVKRILAGVPDDNPIKQVLAPNPILDPVARTGRKLTKAGREIGARSMEGTRRPTGVVDALENPVETLKHYGLTAAQSAPMMAVAAGMRQPELAADLMGVLTGGQAYGDARIEGVDQTQALMSALEQGLLEKGFEAAPLEIAMGGGSLLKRATLAPLAEAGSEGLTGGGQYVAGQLATGQEIDDAEALRQTADSAIVGHMIGAQAVGVEELARALGAPVAPPAPAEPAPAPTPAPAAPQAAPAPAPAAKPRMRVAPDGTLTPVDEKPVTDPALVEQLEAAPADPLAPRIPGLPELEPGVTRDQLIQEYADATSDETRAAAAARIAAFEQNAHQESSRVEAEEQEGSGQEGQQEGQGGSEVEGHRGLPGEAQAVGEAVTPEPAGKVSGDRMSLESPIGQAAQAGVARVKDAPRLVVHQDTSSIPDDIKDRSQASGGIDEGVEGFYDEKNDTIHIVAAGVDDAERADWVIDHEIGHATLRSAVRRQKTGMRAAMLQANQNPTVAAIVRSMAQGRPETGTIATEEAVVELITAHQRGGWDQVERQYGVKVPQNVRTGADTTIKRIIEAIRQVLKKITGRGFTDADVHTLIQRAQRERSVDKRTNSKDDPHRRADDKPDEPKPMPNGLVAGRRYDAEGEHVPDTAFAKRDDETHDQWEARVLDTQRNTTVFSRAPAPDSAAFKMWFGDSKVVNEDGSPKVVYHGADTDEGMFEAFREEEGAWGTFFASDREHAEAFQGGDGDVVEAYLRIENPLTVTQEMLDEEHDKLSEDDQDVILPRMMISEFIERAKAAGHDGIIAPNFPDLDFDDTVYIAFKPTQIKSTDNQGSFGRDDERIAFSRARTRSSILRDLTPAEQKKLTDKVAEKVIAQLKALPSTKEMAAVALAGKAKRGWYAESARTIEHVFGPDGPRFAMLLAAMSPQTSVESNLRNALETWANWTKAGRPTDRQDIVRIMGRSVEGSRGEASVLNAWINNSVRALSADDVTAEMMSGPKVNSFFQNLIGNVQEVTNDAWMANFAAVNQTIFKGGLSASGLDPGKGTGYLAMNAQVRRTARQLTEMTGEEWTPAEVQETIWSWAKTVYEMADSAEEIRTAEELVIDGAVTDELIASTPDFGTLFTDPKYASILQGAGYAQQLEDLARRPAARKAGKESGAGLEAGQAAAPDQAAVRAAARRLDRVRRDRLAAERVKAPGEYDDEVPFSRKPAKNVYGQNQGLDLIGLPVKTKVGDEVYEFHGFKPAQAIAARFAARHGSPLPKAYARVDEARAARIAAAYDEMRHEPDSLIVKASYDAMIEETLEQYEAILATGLKVEFIPPEAHHHAHATYDDASEARKQALKEGKSEAEAQDVYDSVLDMVYASNDAKNRRAMAEWDVAEGRAVDPYAQSPRMAILDVVENNHLWVFPTDSGFGDNNGADPFPGNPLLAPTKYKISGKVAVANDIFRAVHDYFGHIANGVGFRADGEENAWREHSAMYSPLARRAMTTETRGQNSWVNFGPYGEANRTASSAATRFADQKTGLLPRWVSEDGRNDGGEAPLMPAVAAQRYRAGDRVRYTGQAGEGPKGRFGGRMRGSALDAGEIATVTHYDSLEGRTNAGDPNVVYVTRANGEGAAVFARDIEPVNDVAMSRNVTNTPEFKRWFGDSKVVDENGSPRVVYHGTGHDFDTFQGDNQLGHFFTSEPGSSWLYSEQVGDNPVTYPVYLSLQNPMVVEARGASWDDIQIDDALRAQLQGYFDGYEDGTVDTDTLAKVAKQKGHDGLIVNDVVDGGDYVGNDYVAFKPEQIKSSVGNAGTFDPENPSIVFSRSFNAKKVQPDAVAVNAVHYSNTPGLTSLDPKRAGTGAAGRERRRFGMGVFGKNGGTSARVNFYVQEGDTPPDAEDVVREGGGVHGYAVRLTNLYDGINDPRGIVADSRGNPDAMEEEISDQGFDGFLADGPAGIDGQVAVVFDIGNKKIPVDPLEESVVASRVFHGTPHEVDRFSLQKIGSGEGAQAFGWGLYFTDQESLAHSYRKALSAPKLAVDGKTVDMAALLHGTPGDWDRAAAKAGLTEVEADVIEMIAFGETRKEGLADAHFSVRKGREWVAAGRPEIGDATDRFWRRWYFRDMENMSDEEYLAGLDEIESFLNNRVSISAGGRVYAVDIPDQDDLLWYDDVVSDMPKKVQDSIRAAFADLSPSFVEEVSERMNEDLTEDYGIFGLTGREVYQIMEKAAVEDAIVTPHPDLFDRAVSAPQQASHHLYTHGVPGLRFLAGGSRTRSVKQLEQQIANYQKRIDDILADNDPDPQDAYNLKDARLAKADLERELEKARNPKYNFVMWDESQISEPSVVFSRGVPLPPAVGIKPLAPQLDEAREKLQDRMLRLRRAQEFVAPVTPDAMDAYTLENLMYGAAKDKLEAADRDFVKPLIEMMKRNGLTVDQLHDYLLARHAPERNARIATINPALPDGGSGISTADANAIMAGTHPGPYSGKPLSAATRNRAAAAAVLVDRMHARTIDILESSQQITPALANQLRTMYQHYVPLRGDGQEEWMQRPAGTGKGLSVVGAAIKRALGRGEGNLADNITGEMVAEHQRAIVQGEKAKVTQAFLRFAKANPMPDLYTVEPVDMEWKFSKATGQAYLGVKSVLEDASRSIVVPDGGKFVRIRFEDERLRDAIMHMSVDDFGAFVKYAGIINRWRSAVLTRFNPGFVPVNVLRDLQFGMTAVAAEHGAKIAAETSAGYIPALKALWKDAGQPTGNAAVPNAQKTWDDWAREYVALGVKTGLSQVEDVNALQKRLSVASTTLIQLAAQGKPITASVETVRRAVTPIAEAIERVNDATENALRLSVYAALRKTGWSEQRAGAYAKNVTINFNRKGSLGPIINAVYLFFNASMQGTQAVVRVIRKPAVLAMLVAMGGLQAMLAASMMGDDDDDGITDWDQVPDYAKRTSLVIPLGPITGNMKDYFALPMPYGFNLFPYAGGRIAQWVKQGARPTDNSLFMDMLKSTTEAFSPVPMFEGYAALFGDTIGSLMQLASNEDDLGRPITAENPYATYEAPKALSGRPDTPRGYQVMSQLMAKIGGGDLEKRIPPVGFLDVAPEQLEYVANFMGGGLMGIVNKGTRWWEQKDADLLTREFDQVAEAPILSRMLGSGKEARAVAERYYGERGEFARELDRLKERVRAGQDPDQALAEAQAETPALAGVALDRYKKDRFIDDGDGGHMVAAGQVKLTETGAPKLKATPGSAFDVHKETERVNEEVGRAIRAIRAPETTLGQVYDLIDGTVPVKASVEETLGVEPGYNRDAVAASRVRQRAIKALQDYRAAEQKRFLQALQTERRSKR